MNEYDRNVTKEECIAEHKQYYSRLDRPLIVTYDDDGFLCIRWNYKDGGEDYFHYAKHNGELVWW